VCAMASADHRSFHRHMAEMWLIIGHSWNKRVTSYHFTAETNK